MNNSDTDFETYRNGVLASTTYNYTEEDIREAYDEGVSVDDLVAWADYQIDCLE